ncbi:Hypothetical predicted protein [Mytilus galloprovincialis]|uniref:Uncharacterized protein n=1 Tax=Mytilus galloprovincialis TaxID=29158 RepID=A0A8B6HBX1_MYTGA|nr:Hypothetical predicted protein [Mytilus galloprovincialis]
MPSSMCLDNGQTTQAILSDQHFVQSSPIHSTNNHFLSSWTGQPTLPSSITPLIKGPSIVHRPSIPSTFAKRLAPITNRLQTPQHFSFLYPKLPISATASTTTPIASTVTAITATIGSPTTFPVTTAVGTGAVSGTGAETGVVSEESSRIRIRSNSIFPRGPCLATRRTAKPRKNPDNYKQHVHYKLDSAFVEGLDIFAGQQDDIISFKKGYPIEHQVTDCDNDTTIPYGDDQPFSESSPIKSNPFVSSWAGPPTLPSSTTPVRPSIIHRPIIPSKLSKTPTSVAGNSRLQTPQHFAALYPSLTTTATATTAIATAATSA